MESSLQRIEDSGAAAQGVESMSPENASPGGRESLKAPARPGAQHGLDDRRGILDSPVLLPLMTVSQRQGFCWKPVLERSGRLKQYVALQEEPSPTTGISLPAFTAALGLEAGAKAFAAARGGQATARVKEVSASLLVHT